MNVTNVMKISTILMFFLLFLHPSVAKTITVCDTCESPSIQEAVDSANNGDLIEIMGGGYRESVTVNKSLKIVGKGVVNLYPRGPKPGFELKASDTSIENINIIGGYAGVGIEDGNNISIRNCNITHNYYGVFSENSSDLEIAKNKISDNNYSIYLQLTRESIIEGNKISNSTIGLKLMESGKILVKENLINSRDAGIILFSSSKNTIEKNEVDQGIVILRSSENQLVNNNANLISLFSSDGNFISENSIGEYTNMQSNLNRFQFGTLNFTGYNFKFSTSEAEFAEYRLLSNEVNITIIPDIYTEEGFVTFETELPVQKLRDLDLQTIGIYKVKKDELEMVSHPSLDEPTASRVKINYTTEKSGIYLLAGKPEHPAPSPASPTPFRTTTSISTPEKRWVPGFELLPLAVGLLIVAILRRRRI